MESGFGEPAASPTKALIPHSWHTALWLSLIPPDLGLDSVQILLETQNEPFTDIPNTLIPRSRTHYWCEALLDCESFRHVEILKGKESHSSEELKWYGKKKIEIMKSPYVLPAETYLSFH